MVRRRERLRRYSVCFVELVSLLLLMNCKFIIIEESDGFYRSCGVSIIE